MKEKVLLEINRARVDLDFDSLSDEQYIIVCERLASIESALLEEAAEQKLRWTRLPPQVIRDWSGEEEDKAWAHLDNPHAPE